MHIGKNQSRCKVTRNKSHSSNDSVSSDLQSKYLLMVVFTHQSETKELRNKTNKKLIQSELWMGGLLNKPQWICKGIFRISVSNCKSQKVYKTGEWFGAPNNWVFCLYYITTLGFVSYVSEGNHEEVHLIMWTNQLMSIIYLSVKFHDTGPTGAMQKIDGLIF